MKENGSGFFFSARIGDFRPARNGHFRLALTLLRDICVSFLQLTYHKFSSFIRR